MVFKLMMLFLLEIVLWFSYFCTSSLCSEIHIETNNGSKELIGNYGLNVKDIWSVKFMIKACNEVSIGLFENGNNITCMYKVLFGVDENNVSQIRSATLSIPPANASWSGLDCKCYVNLWISWSHPYIKAGTGTTIDKGTLLSWPTFITYVTNIEVTSVSLAHWIFSANSTSACTLAPVGPVQTNVNTNTTTPITTNATDSTDISSTKTPCTCSCINNISIADDELLKKIEQLRSELIVDTKKTNKYKRSLISSADDRSSSKLIGSLSVTVLVIVFCIIILMDFQHYAPYIFPTKN